MNKKGQSEFIIGGVIIALIVIGIIVGAVFLIPLSFNHGTSNDYPYTVEKQFGWYKLWLKDDHTTIYCFDNPDFNQIIEQAKVEGKKIAVTYQDYWFRGGMCFSGSDNIGTTVVTDIQIIK